MLTTLFLVLLATLIFAIIFASISEWALHRYVMHRIVKIFGYRFDYSFVAHTLVHHRIFRANESYHLQDDAMKEKIPMAWWNSLVIIGIGGIPVYTAAYLIGTVWEEVGWVVFITSLSTFFSYYCIYEWIHWCMHCPNNRTMERWRVLRFLNGHHLLHHQYMDNNLNVVLPLADWIFGTLILKAKRPFAQPLHADVPDVQPSAI